MQSVNGKHAIAYRGKRGSQPAPRRSQEDEGGEALYAGQTARRPAPIRSRNRDRACFCCSARNCVCSRTWTCVAYVCAPAQPPSVRRTGRRHHRPDRPALHGGVAARSGPVNRSPAFAGLPHVAGRSALPDQRTLRSQPIPGASDRPASRHNCREHENKGGRSGQDDAGGVRRPRNRATTVIARARSSTSIILLCQELQHWKTRTENWNPLAVLARQVLLDLIS